MINFYPIITRSRPNLLLPWLILSFFKNVVLEVIVIAVGLLLWYDRRFSLPIFLEFVVVKVVPLVFAAYNWYSNSCLYLELRRFERMRKLRRSMRSDSNLIASRLYLKIADSKCKTRSVTTLISWSSYDTYDTNDTISRIIENPNLTPAQKTMRILGIGEHEVEEARTRVKERTMRQRLTEVDEEEDSSLTRDIRPYFAIVGKYEFDMKTLLPPRSESMRSDIGKNLNIDGEGPSGINKNNQSIKSEPMGRGSTLVKTDASSTPRDTRSSKNQETQPNPKNTTRSASPANDYSRGISDNSRNNPTSSRNDAVSGGNSGHPRNSSYRESNLSAEMRSSTRRRAALDSLKAKRSKQMRLCSSCHVTEFKHSSSFSRRRDPARLYSGRNVKETVDASCSPVKMQSMLNCNCMAEEYAAAEKMEECCVSSGVRMMTSTPNKTSDRDTELDDTQNDSEGPQDLLQQLCESDCVDEEKTLPMNGADPCSVNKSMKQELNVLPSLDMNKDHGLECNSAVDGKVDQNIETTLFNEITANSMIYREKYLSVADSTKDLAKNLNTAADIASNFESFKTLEDVANTVKMETEIARAVVSVKCAISSETGIREKSILNPYVQSNDKNLVNLNLPKYSFIDTSIPRFYKNSMKVFDGCYEKDFANNSEVQCLLEQLEKKNWSLFHGHTDHGGVVPPSILMQNEQYAIQDLKTSYHLINDFENIDRYEISATNCEQTADDVPSMTNESQNPIYHTLTKNVYTQTNDQDSVRSSCNSLVKSKKRGKPFLKRKRTKDDTRSGSPTSTLHSRNIEPQNSSCKTNAKTGLRYSRFKPADSQKKVSQIPKSLSDRSVCECKMPQVDSKQSNQSSDWKSDRKPKSKVETYATAPLSQVARTSMFETVVYRRKPPVYPKKPRDEFSTQTGGPAVSAKKLSALKKLLEASARKPVEGQSTSNSKKIKWKSKSESEEGQEAKELRALKAYNEITLLRYKQKLEAEQKLDVKQKLTSRKSSQERAPQVAKTLIRTRKINGERSKHGSPRNADENHLDQENLSLDVATETERVGKPASRGVRATGRAGKFASVSSDKYPCAKLSKVNKVTDHLLENFDRLHGRQANQDSKKARHTVETNTRKQYTKYSKPNKVAGEENVSVVSIKKLEGTQTGRELERTPAKEDVRNISLMSLASLLEEQDESTADVTDENNDYHKKPSTFGHGVDIGMKNGKLHSTIKSMLFQDVISTWSSSTTDRTDEIQDLVSGNASVESQLRTTVRFEEISKQEDGDPTKTPVETSSVVATQSTEPPAQVEFDSKTEDDGEQRPEPSRTDNQQLVSTSSEASLDHFIRNIEVAYMNNYVLLTNPSAPKDAQPQRRTILDDDTIRMLQHAYSDRSLYFIFDISREILSVGDVLSNVQMRWDSDEFICQPNRETMGVPMEDLPPLAHEENRLEQTILATFRQYPNFEAGNEEDGSQNLFITTIDSESMSLGGGLEVVDDFDDEDDMHETTDHISVSGFGLNDVLSTVFGLLRCMNASGLHLNTSFGLAYRIFHDPFDDDDDDYETDELDSEEEEEARRMIEERLLRFIKDDDIFTDIRFPIVVNLSDVIAGSSDSSIDFSDELDIDLTEIEPSKVNLFSFDEKEERKIGLSGKFENARELVSLRDVTLEPLAGPAELSSRQFMNPRDLVSSGNYSNAKGLEDESYDEEFSYVPNRCHIVMSTLTQSYKKRPLEEILSKTYDLIDIDEVSENDVEITTENSKFGKVSTNKQDIEMMVAKTQFTAIDHEKTEELETLNVEESLETIEKKFLLQLQAIQGSPMINSEDEDEDEDQDELEEETPSEPVSFTSIFTFWFLVVYFYMQHFYNKMFTFNRISRSTMALKPFEIHTVPTSTSTLLENAELAEQLREDSDSNSEKDEEVEESDLLKGIIDVDEERNEREENESASREDLSSSNGDSRTFVIRPDARPDIENMKILHMEFLSSSNSRSKRSDEFRSNGLSIVELQGEEETEEIESSHTDIDSSFESQSFGRTGKLLANHSLFDNVSESNEIPVVPELDEKKRLELRQAEEEIEALRFEEDDCSSDEDEINFSSEVETNFDYAERGATDVDQAPNMDEVRLTDDESRSASFDSSKLEDRAEGSNHSENTYDEEEMDASEGSVFSKPKDDEADVSTTTNQAESSAQVSNTVMQTNDSFDSTYTVISDKSKYTESVPDLNDSSMEDFKANETIESD